MRDVVIHVCVTCRREGDEPDAPRQGAVLHAAVEAIAGPGLHVAGVECLGNCKRSCSVAIRAEACWTYVFGDLTCESASDVVAGAALLSTSPDGLMPWRGRPEAFKRGMIARIPPLDLSKEAAE